MRSLLKEIESKFIEIEESLDPIGHEDDDIDNDSDCDNADDYLHHRRTARKKAILQDEDELDEISATGGVAGYNIPAAFAKPGHWKNKNNTYESVNVSPSWKLGDYQAPEDAEEEYTDKFPFAADDKIWQHKSYKYPSIDLRDTPGLSKRKDKTTNQIKLGVAEAMDAKYEKLIESYRAYATGDNKTTPESKIKHTIKEVAKQLQEIEQTVNYASKLKTESGVARKGYGPAVDKALNKISERLIKISERVRALGE